MEIWLIYSLLIMFIYTIWTIMQEYIVKNHDDCFCVNYKIYIVAGLISFIYLMYHLKSHECTHSKTLMGTIKYSNIKVWSIILFISILIIIVAKYWVLAVIDNGNSGYVTAITSISIIFITLYSYYTSNDNISSTKLMGVIIMLIGTGMIAI